MSTAQEKADDKEEKAEAAREEKAEQKREDKAQAKAEEEAKATKAGIDQRKSNALKNAAKKGDYHK